MALRSFVSALVALALLAVGSGPAAAAVVSGSNLSVEPNAGICVSGEQQLSCVVAVSTLFAANRAPGGTRASTAGVIVGWSVRSMASAVKIPMQLQVVHGSTGGGTGPLEELPTAAGIHSFPARVPVQAGDLIGIRFTVPPLKSVPVARNSFDATFDFWNPPLAEGETRAPTFDEVPSEVLVNATIEPDADQDGYGDETQDCSVAPGPGECNKGSGSPAPPPAGGGSGTNRGGAATVPATRLTRGPTGTIRSTRASFSFNSDIAGARFQCKLDKKLIKTCRSPKVFSRLKPGRHRFQVRAIGPTGLADPTPAKRGFKVKP